MLRDRDANGGQRRPGVKAIVVYPMNALANSQMGELEKFLQYGYTEGERAGHLRPLHRPGVAGRATSNPGRAAGHPADQLRDARARPDPPGRAQAPGAGCAGPAVPCPRRAAHLPRPAGRRRRDADPPAARSVRVGRPAGHRHQRDDVQRGHDRRAAGGRRPGRHPAVRQRSHARTGHRRDARPRHPGCEPADRPHAARRQSTCRGGRAARPTTRRSSPTRWRRGSRPPSAWTSSRTPAGWSDGPRPPFPRRPRELAELTGRRSRRLHDGAPAHPAGGLTDRRPASTAGRCSPSGCTSSCPRATRSTSPSSPKPNGTSPAPTR